MANALNISSEEDLLQLRNEGKITEDEYQDLLYAMSKAIPGESEGYASQVDKARSKRRLGKISFYLMLAGIILPIIGFVFSSSATGWGEMDVIFGACFLACVLVELLAFVFGVISLPDVFGIATVATILALAALWASYQVLWFLTLLSAR
jgi:uncharacterized integral membrane protein